MTTHTSGAADLPEATATLIERLEDAVYEWGNYVDADHAPRPLTRHVDPHIKAIRAELERLHALAAGQAVAPADGWLQDGGLLYRLTDERQPCNRDEINVTMANGSRSLEDRAKRAGELLDCIRARPWPVEEQPDGTVNPVDPADMGICPAPPAMDGGEDVAMEAHQKNGLAWAVHRWEDEVKHRPLQNVHRRSLDDAWRQVVRYFGGDPDAQLGPCHDAARAAQKEGS